mmetsp:Transcript_68511/g.221381  ORF Transcript_68511/g.221381 Transcript_68511/m.221381 type:complete len:239 (+) Transcript_68511:923-1639(+)
MSPGMRVVGHLEYLAVRGPEADLHLREDHKHHRPEEPEVTRLVHLELRVAELWWCIQGCPAGAKLDAVSPGKAKVDDLDLMALPDHDVVRLQVAVHPTTLVEMPHALNQLPEVVHPLGYWQRPGFGALVHLHNLEHVEAQRVNSLQNHARPMWATLTLHLARLQEVQHANDVLVLLARLLQVLEDLQLPFVVPRPIAFVSLLGVEHHRTGTHRLRPILLLLALGRVDVLLCTQVQGAI